MKRVTFTIACILLIFVAAHISRVQGNQIDNSVQPAEQATSTQKTSQSLADIISSGPVHAFPEPATLALFGVGFLLVVGFGWIKKTPDKF